jgi:hypothetical protein
MARAPARAEFPIAGHQHGIIGNDPPTTIFPSESRSPVLGLDEMHYRQWVGGWW